MSLLSRDSTYKLLKSVCGHLDVSTTSLSLHCCLSSVFHTVSSLIRCFILFPYFQNTSVGNSPNPSSLENSLRADRPSSLPLVSCPHHCVNRKEREYVPQVHFPLHRDQRAKGTWDHNIRGRVEETGHFCSEEKENHRRS